MRLLVRFAMLLHSAVSLSMLSSCGSNGIAPIAASPSLAGNWGIVAVSTPSSPSQIAGVGGALLVSSSGAITGMLHALPAKGVDKSSLCYAMTNAIPVTGSLTADDTLVLSSSNFGGNTLTVRGTYVAGVGSALPSLTNATYSIAGPCGVAAQAVKAAQVPPISGTYTGVAQFSHDAMGYPINIPVTATFSQATTPDAKGLYYVTGTATFGSDPCVAGPVTTTSLVVPSGINGPVFEVSYTDSATGTLIVTDGFYDLDTIDLYPILLSNSTAAFSQCNDRGGGFLTKQQ